MKVLVDTCVWSLALRRRRAVANAWTARLRELVGAKDAVLLGIVRQELLSGVRDRAQFERLRESLRVFADVPVEVGDYEIAAEFANRCRAGGVQGNPIDFLLCAVAYVNEMGILTSDRDFRNYAAHLPVPLIDPLP